VTNREAVTTAEMFALKTVLIESDSVEQRKKEKEYWREVDILGRLRHPGIIRVLDQGMGMREGKRELHLLTELGKGGNLLRFLDAVVEAGFTPRDNEAIYKHCIAQIVETVDYLQSMGISHRDLKV
jgi:serine/threonine protein kinase